MPNRPALPRILSLALAALLAAGAGAETSVPPASATPATAAAPAASAPSSAASAAATTCSDCGRVLAVREVSPPNGSIAGRVLERRMGARKGWVVDVQYDRQDQVMHYVFPQEPGFKVGDKVRPEGSGIARP